jgi:hypothetical protein
MLDNQEKLGTSAAVDKSKKDGKKGKLKFTPPVLHDYGEVVKICRGGHELQDANDIYYGVLAAS